jgi:hypothetical protein
MTVRHTKIGEHIIQILSTSSMVNRYLNEHFNCINMPIINPDLKITIRGDYEHPFESHQVETIKDNGKVIFRRSDYLIESDCDYKTSKILVHNELSLKHALMNLYSSYIVRHNWGIILHSSCVIEEGKAHIFAGPSGAGKSTVARLSKPRDLLSDEAALVKITDQKVSVFHSPFWSEEVTPNRFEQVPLESIQILYQSLQNERMNMRKADAFIHLMDKVFYWSHDPEETRKIMGQLRKLIDRIPVFELYFKKDNTFWELIS